MKTDDQWRAELTPQQYEVLRRGATEAPFTGRHWARHDDGTYRCAGCGTVLFSSATKFDSGSGWPSFTEPEAREAVELREDRSLPWEARIEVVCRTCGGHLGHVFPDGPPERGGMRFCINDCALEFHAGDRESSERG